MATKTLNYSLEFKQKIDALYRSGQTQNKLARDYGLAHTFVMLEIDAGTAEILGYLDIVNLSRMVQVDKGR